MIAKYLAKNYTNVVVFVDKLVSVNQLFNEFRNFLNDYCPIEVTGQMNIENLSNVILANKNLICCSYRSVKKINTIVPRMNNCFIIVDEWHKLSEKNIFNQNDEFNKLLTGKINKDCHYLFMSATPKRITIEGVDCDKIYEELCGNITYTYSFENAIKNRIVNDYVIICPDKTKNEHTEYNVYTFLYIKMIENKFRKCIIYNKNTKESKDMVTNLMKIHENNGEGEIFVKEITSVSNSANRQKILKEFSETTNLAFLSSVNMLNECINIVMCDSVYITYSAQSETELIQRISRCLRAHETKPRVSGIILFSKDVNELTCTIKTLNDSGIFMYKKSNVNKNSTKTSDNTIMVENITKNLIKDDTNDTYFPRNKGDTESKTKIINYRYHILQENGHHKQNENEIISCDGNENETINQELFKKEIEYYKTEIDTEDKVIIGIFKESLIENKNRYITKKDILKNLLPKNKKVFINALRIRNINILDWLLSENYPYDHFFI